MSFSSIKTSTSSAITTRNKVITASASASATSDISQLDADQKAEQKAIETSLVVAKTQSALIDTSYLNETVPTLTYYLNVDDFIKSMVEVPTTLPPTTTITQSSLYVYGRAPLYKSGDSTSLGICSASFMCSKNNKDIYTDITNYISLENGLVVSWLTPSRPANLEFDSIVNSMVTECIVTANTKIGINPFYGKVFNLVVSSFKNQIIFTFSSYNN
uniref:Uncharacterized protein n=1 Tax=viral metagenome TaxID=1070528 RepID=A0A6C0B9C8_9ZZZZ